MNEKNKVIPFQGRNRGNKRPVVNAGVPADVVDMTERRQEIIGEERRQVRRTILTEFIGAYVVIPGQGLKQVAVYDVSENGIAFDVELEGGQFAASEEVAMRVYLNHSTYFPFVVRVANVRLIDDENVYRHGGSFIKGTVNETALFHFVKFIESVSASLERDKGDIVVSNLAR